MIKMISGRTLNIKTAVSMADVKAKKVMAIDEVSILVKLREFSLDEALNILGEGINPVPAAIDFANPKSVDLMNLDADVIVSRMTAIPGDSTQVVLVKPKIASAVLEDYFRGYPAHLINWTIYNGLKAEYYSPFPITHF